MRRRFYFHLVDEDDTYEDGEGTVFPSQEAAVMHAAVVACELAQDGSHYLGYHVHLVDDDRNDVARIPVTNPAGDRTH